MFYVAQSTGNIGQSFVIDTLDVANKRLYFKNQIRYDLDTTYLKTGAVVMLIPTSGNKLIIKDLTIKNGGFHAGGYEHVYIDNVHCYLDDATVDYFNDVSQVHKAYFGFSLLWNNKFTLTNSSSVGYTLTGLGYGLQCGMGNIGVVDNFYTYDCRHGVTTTITTPEGNWLNELYILNSQAYMSAGAKAFISSNVTAYDTHAGLDRLVIKNSYAENQHMFTKMRSDHFWLSESRAVDCDYIVNASTYGQEPKEFFINDCQFDGVQAIIDLQGQEFRYIKVDNVIANNQVIPSGVDTYFFRFADSGLDSTLFIDTLSITNSTFTGTKGWTNTARFIYNYGANRQEVGNFILANNEFRELKTMVSNFSVASTGMFKDFEIANNHFTNVNGSFQFCGTGADNKGDYRKALFIGNILDNCNIFDDGNSDSQVLNNWIFADNTFYKCNDMLDFGDNVEWRDVQFTGNKVIAPQTQAVMFSLGEILFKNNIFTSTQSGYGIFFSLGASASARVYNNTFNYLDAISDHYWMSDHSGGGSVGEWVGNTFYFSDSANVSTWQGRIYGTHKFFDNHITWLKATSPQGFFRMMGSGSELWLDGNTWDFSGVQASENAVYGISGGTIYLGRDTYWGTNEIIDLNSATLDQTTISVWE